MLKKKWTASCYLRSCKEWVTYCSLISGSLSGLRQEVRMGMMSSSSWPITGPAPDSRLLNRAQSGEWTLQLL